MGTDDAVVVDADGDRLRVTKAGRRRVAAPARIVAVESADRVEPQQSAQEGELTVDFAVEAMLESVRDGAGESELVQPGLEIGVDRPQRVRRAHERQGSDGD